MKYNIVVSDVDFFDYVLVYQMVASTNFVRMLFLGEALTTMIVYIGCRRNPFVMYNFFGLFRFQAPYLPWILVLFSVLFGGSVAVDLVGT